jgi:cyclin L
LNTLFPAEQDPKNHNPDQYYVSDGTHYARQTRLIFTEAEILKTLGFDTTVVLPYTLCITYLQTLDVFQIEGRGTASKLTKRAFALLNSSLHNPQLVYLTHQPAELACAAIYLAAREVGVKLPEEEWWEVFDTDRETLGFLVVAMRSMEGFVSAEKEKWIGSIGPVTKEVVERMMKEDREKMGS